MRNELYIERSKVRGILIGRNAATQAVLSKIDALPIFTAEDFGALAQRAPVTDAMVERAWAAIVGRDIAPQCFNASIIRADLRTGLEAALTSTERSDKLPLDIESTKEDYARAVLGPTLPPAHRCTWPDCDQPSGHDFCYKHCLDNAGHLSTLSANAHMKRCSCGRLATHFVVLLQPDGEPKGKKLMCDAFPKCRPPADGGGK